MRVGWMQPGAYFITRVTRRPGEVLSNSGWGGATQVELGPSEVFPAFKPQRLNVHQSLDVDAVDAPPKEASQ